MQLNLSDTPTPVMRTPFLNLRWGGIFAGLSVGIACNLLLLLVGVSIGLGVFDVNKMAEPGHTASIAAMVWNVACMIIAAFVGGYVAARAAGMHRSSDGVLHGAVSWGATMLVSMFLAAYASSAVFGSMFSSVSGIAGNMAGTGATGGNAGGAAKEVATQIQAGDRQAAVDSLRTRLGLSSDQAGKVVDQALIASGHPESASPAGREAADQAAKTAATVSSSLSAAVVLSLIAAIGGGLLGARGTRRTMGHIEKRHVQQEELSRM
ncbi:MAG TPA: hypothetical protein VF801_13350 [Rhodocyclaceae bacterium]